MLWWWNAVIKEFILQFFDFTLFYAFAKFPISNKVENSGEMLWVSVDENANIYSKRKGTQMMMERRKKERKWK